MAAEQTGKTDLDPDGFRSLSDQKASDFRFFVQTNVSLVAASGAITAAAIATKTAYAFWLAPLPLVFGVFQLIQNAKLQLRLTTYLAAFGPAGRSFERDLAAVRPRYLDRKREAGGFARLLNAPDAWRIWIAGAFSMAEPTVLYPWATGLRHGGLVAVAGTTVVVAAVLAGYFFAKTIESERELWSGLWAEHTGR
jgi:hypothetical protein